MVVIMNPYIGTRSWAFVGYARSTSSSVDLSSLSAGAIAEGDLCVYVDFGSSTGAPTAVTPSGFTNRIDTTIPGHRGMLSEKKLTGSETTVTGMDATTDRKVALVFRPSLAFTTATPSTATSEVSNGNPSSQSISPSAETTAVILVGVAATDAGTAAFATASPSFDATIATTDADLLVGYKTYAAGSAANHTIDMNDLGSGNWLAGIYYIVS